MSNLGFIGGLELFSKEGFINIISMVIFMVIIILLVSVCKKEHMFYQDKFIVCFFLAALMIHVFAYVFFMKEYKARYMLPFFMLLPYVVLTIMKEWKPSCKKLALIILAVCFLLTSVNAAGKIHEQGNHQGINIAKQKEMADFLVHNGYQYGFSTFWYTNSTIQISDGQLDICALNSPNDFKKLKWLNTKDQIDYDYQGKTFFIVSDAQLEENKGRSWNQEEKIIWHDGGICVFEYTSVKELSNVFEN